MEDLARACVSVLEADPEIVRQQVFNVGDTRENYQKKMLAEELQKLVPEMKVKYVQKNEDPRDYRVAFEKSIQLWDLPFPKECQMVCVR